MVQDSLKAVATQKYLWSCTNYVRLIQNLSPERGRGHDRTCVLHMRASEKRYISSHMHMHQSLLLSLTVCILKNQTLKIKLYSYILIFRDSYRSVS